MHFFRCVLKNVWILLFVVSHETRDHVFLTFDFALSTCAFRMEIRFLRHPNMCAAENNDQQNSRGVTEDFCEGKGGGVNIIKNMQTHSL